MGNPNNKSRYARHRSIRKGETAVLEQVLEQLEGIANVTYKEYQANGNQKGAGTVIDEVKYQWGGWNAQTLLTAKDTGKANDRYDMTGGGFPLQTDKVSEGLRGNFKLVYEDFWALLLKLQDKHEKAAKANQLLIVIAYTNDFFDILFAKHGRNPSSHEHFYHWHATSRHAKFSGKHPWVHVDDNNVM